MSTADAAELMADHQIRRLPVVEGDQLVGILSLGDIAVKEGKDKAHRGHPRGHLAGREALKPKKGQITFRV
jgi:CBS-domain-containing membrane protein